MDRTFVSVNLQNMITVPAMVFVMFLLVALGWQFVSQFFRNKSSGAANSGGY